ncbi:hypothetical protein VUR80DRAFT_5688 [Thermomyces stellatus]
MAQERIDYNRICSNSQNITLSSPRGNITFRGGYIVEDGNSPPTIWRLDKQGEQYAITAVDPIGRNLAWYGNSGNIQISAYGSSRFDIRTQALRDRGQIVIAVSGNCLSFNDGYATLYSNAACEPLTFSKIRTPPWNNPTARSQYCSESMVDDFVTGLRHLLESKAAMGGDIHSEGFWDGVKSFTKAVYTGFMNAGDNVVEAINRIDPNWPRQEYKSLTQPREEWP